MRKKHVEFKLMENLTLWNSAYEARPSQGTWYLRAQIVNSTNIPFLVKVVYSSGTLRILRTSLSIHILQIKNSDGWKITLKQHDFHVFLVLHLT